MKCIFLFFICLLFANTITAQSIHDSVLLQEITITEPLDLQYAGSKQSNIDKETIALLSSANMADVLSLLGGAQQRTYGGAGMSLLSFRGAATSHTTVLWNGVPLESPMNGQYDIGAVSAFLFDNVQVLHSGNARAETPSAIGATVSLQSKPDWNNRFRCSLGQQNGSFFYNHSNIGVSAGNEKIQSKTALSLLSNNFGQSDFDTRVKNSSSDTYNAIQELFLSTGSNSFLSVRYWFNHSNKLLPDIKKGNEQQADKQSYVHTSWQGAYRKAIFNASIAYQRNQMQYINKLSDIEALHQFGKWHGLLQTRYELSPLWKINGGVNVQKNSVQSTNYKGVKNDNYIDIFVANNFTWRQYQLYMLLRQRVGGSMSLPLVPSAGFDIKIFSRLYFSGNVSRTFRAPTLNDLYWQPGGNTDLIAEKGFATEISCRYLSDKQNNGFSGNATFFYSQLQHGIVWLPNVSFWQPVNVRQIQTHGTELDISYRYIKNNTTIWYKIAYNYTKALNMQPINDYDLSERKQMLYVPVHAIQAVVSLKYKNWQILYSQQTSSKRYTAADNSAWLPAFSIGNIIIGRLFSFWRVDSKIQLQCQNIYNTKYSTIAGYVMPHRSYIVSIQISYDKNRNF